MGCEIWKLLTDRNPAILKSLQTSQEVYILKSCVRLHQQTIHTRAFILILILWNMVIEKNIFVRKIKRAFATESMASMRVAFCLPMS